MKTNPRLLMSAVVLATVLSSRGQPVITLHPTNTMPTVGGSADFSVTATGSPPPTYQWRFNGTDLPNETANSLSLVNVQFTNAGPYSVVVSNDSGGVTSQTAWLSVLPTSVVNLGDLELSFGVPTNPPVWEPERIDDGAPSLSDDGLTLFFSSQTRPDGFGGWDLYMVTRPAVSSTWSAPMHLESPINTAAAEDNPRLSPDGLSLYFDSDRPGGHGQYDVWVATRQTPTGSFGAPANLGPAVNSGSPDFTSSVSGDNLTLVFSSLRSGGGDLWITTRTNAQASWEPARNLGQPVNSPQLEVTPCLSRDGRLLFFTSNRTGSGRIWVSRRASPASPFGSPILIPSLPAADYPSLSDDSATLYFTSYRVVFPDWPTLRQTSIQSLPQLKAMGQKPTGEFEIELLGRAGATYEIQVSPDFGAWTPWLTTNTSGSMILSDPASATEGQRFYRVLSQ